MGSDSDAVSFFRPLPFVEVFTADGTRRRFAAGTKAGFAIDRINSKGEEAAKRYSFIESIKEGEEAVEFGPDAELVSYGEGWKLRAVQDVKFLKSVPFGVSKVQAKDELKVINQPLRKEFNLADFYPGGKLPEGSPPENSLAYCWNISIMLGILFLIAGFWVYLLESLGDGSQRRSPW